MVKKLLCDQRGEGFNPSNDIDLHKYIVKMDNWDLDDHSQIGYF
jgi:hypothetical protein